MKITVVWRLPHLIEFATMLFFLESIAFSELQGRVKYRSCLHQCTENLLIVRFFPRRFFPFWRPVDNEMLKQRFSLYNLLLTVRKRLLRVLVDKFGTRSVASVVSYSWSSRKNKRNCLGALNPTKKRYQPPKKNMHINARYELAKHVNRLSCTFLYVEVFSNKFAIKLMFSCDVA